MVYVYSVFAYVIVTSVICWIGFLQGSWLATANQHVLIFRKPAFYRIGTAMMSLLFLAGAIFFILNAQRPHNSGEWVLSVLFLPFAVLFAYIAGPQDVCVDLETRICHETIGWMIHPRKRSLPLTEASCLSICSDNTSYYVNLMIGGGTKRYFMIARPSSKSQAHKIADPIAEMLHIPVKETTLAEMRQLA